MGKVCCPTCKGAGTVEAETAVAIYEARERGEKAYPRRDANGWPLDDRDSQGAALCSCDGPPHPYSKGWCPSDGPVRRGYGLD